MKTIFLSSPYTGTITETESRITGLCEMTDMLIKQGYCVICPVLMGHLIVTRLPDTPASWDYWAKTCETLLEKSDEVIVATFSGWENSKGVKAEINLATKLGKPVTYL